MPEPSRIDLAIRQAVREALEPFPQSAQVRYAWGEEAGMWFTEVTPARSGAAQVGGVTRVGHVHAPWSFGAVRRYRPYADAGTGMQPS